jgi:uncharacterized membrane protein YdjX (TVP38/TMEM64 family)
MPDNENTGQDAGTKKKSTRDKVISYSAMAAVIVITIVLLVFQNRVSALGNYGYLGTFFISMVANATIILPVPTFMLLIALGASFNPFLIGIIGGIGGAIGEMTCYLFGFGGRTVVENRRMYDRAVQWLQKWGALTVFLFAVSPSPFDIMGIAAGLLRFPFWKFFIATLAGKIIKYILFALAGAWGWTMFTKGFNSATTVVLASLCAGAVLLIALSVEKWDWNRKRRGNYPD